MNETFDVFRKITEKYKKIRLHLAAVLIVMLICISPHIVYGYIFDYYFFYFPIAVYSVLLVLVFTTDNTTFHLISLTLNLIVLSVFFYIEKDFVTVIGILGIFLIITSYFHIQLIKGNQIKKTLKKVHGYPIFNISITSKEIESDNTLREKILAEIEIAVSDKYLQKEMISVKRTKVNKVFIVTNCIFFLIFASSLLLFSYGNVLRKNIENAKDFETAKMQENVYVKGTINNVVDLSVGGPKTRQYWFKFKGEYLTIEVPGNFQAYDNFLDESPDNDEEIEFVGKYIHASEEYVNTKSLEFQLKDKNIEFDKSEINELYVLKVIKIDGYKTFYNIGYVLLALSVLYFMLYFAIILVTRFKLDKQSEHI